MLDIVSVFKNVLKFKGFKEATFSRKLVWLVTIPVVLFIILIHIIIFVIQLPLLAREEVRMKLRKGGTKENERSN